MLDVTLHENPSPNEAAMTVLSLCSYYSLATLVLFTSMVSPYLVLVGPAQASKLLPPRGQK